MFDPTVTFEDLAWIKAQWPGKFVVKGVQTVADARRVVDVGVDGILLSNHGGRQLDRAPVPFHLLPDVVAEVGNDTEILLDTGIMSGADIVAAIALGARFTLVGRAYLYGLMAGGEAGVRARRHHPVRASGAHHAPARRHLPGRTHPRTRHPTRPAGPTPPPGERSGEVRRRTARAGGGQMAAGMRDVAAAASVSVGTVSNVLNAPHKVAPATVARVHAAIDELGFVRNDAARQLRPNDPGAWHCSSSTSATRSSPTSPAAPNVAPRNSI